MSKHPFTLVLDHVSTQTAGTTVADVAVVANAGLLPGLNPHVDFQAGAPAEPHHALVTP